MTGRHRYPEGRSRSGTRKGVSSLLSYVLYVGIAISAVGLMVTLGTPIIGSLQDSGSYEQMLTEMQTMDETIRGLAGQVEGAQVDYSIDIGKGRMFMADQSLVWTVETTAEPVAPGQRTQIGAVNVTAQELSEERNQLRIRLSYEQNDRILLQGFNGSLGQGVHELRFNHEGTREDQVLIVVER